MPVTLKDIAKLAQVDTMLNLPPAERPTAFFCICDGYAMFVQRAALKLGLRVPEDVSVIGFGNSELGEAAVSPLCTIDEPYEALGQTALRVLLGQACDITPASPDRYLLPAPLICRESVWRN